MQTGLYIVKSGYNYLRHIDHSKASTRASSSYQTPRKLWRQIWKVKTAPKIRIFMWSLCHNELSTKDNLFRRRIILDPICQLCQSQIPETIEHLFLLCPWTQRMWSHPRVHIDISAHITHRMDAWLADLLENRANLPDLETIASLLWQIWKARNHFVFRQQRTHLEQLVEVALTNAKITLNTLQSAAETWTPLLNPNRLWIPPKPGIVKINIDWVFPTECNKGAIACVCRDHSGTLIDGFTSSVQASSALQTEIQALILTLKYLMQKGKAKDHLLVESDCLVLVETMNHLRLPPWECRVLFEESASLIPCFSNLRIWHCKREANSIADWAAKAHGRGTLSPNWAFSPPQLLLDLLCTEALTKGRPILPT